MSTQPHDYSHHPAHDEDQALEDEITRGTVYDRDHAAHRTDSETQPADVGPEKSALRTGTLVWGVLALLLALWSLSVTVLDWNLDPVLVMIGLAVVGGVALVAGGIAGAARSKSS